jgi:hypothetical protein
MLKAWGQSDDIAIQKTVTRGDIFDRDIFADQHDLLMYDLSEVKGNVTLSGHKKPKKPRQR